MRKSEKPPYHWRDDPRGIVARETVADFYLINPDRRFAILPEGRKNHWLVAARGKLRPNGSFFANMYGVFATAELAESLKKACGEATGGVIWAIIDNEGRGLRLEGAWLHMKYFRRFEFFERIYVCADGAIDVVMSRTGGFNEGVRPK